MYRFLSLGGSLALTGMDNNSCAESNGKCFVYALDFAAFAGNVDRRVGFAAVRQPTHITGN